MSEEKKKRNKIIGISIGIFVVLLVVISSTYAYWQVTKSQDDPNSIVAACLDITMENQTGTFGTTEAYPISDVDGLKADGFTFTVENHCEEDVAYVIGMDSVEVDITGTDGYLLDGSIKVSIDNTTPRIFGSLEDIEHIEENDTYEIRTSKKINTAVVKNGQPNTHTIKAWIDSESPVSENNKIFGGRVFITGGQLITDDNPITKATDESCFTMNGGEIIGYNESCGTSVTIPMYVGENAVTTIDSNAFKTTALTSKYLNSSMELTDAIDTSSMNVAVVFNNYVEGGEVPSEIAYLIKLTNDTDINNYFETQATSMSVPIYTTDTVPELEEGQLKMYQQHTLNGSGETDIGNMASEYVVSSTKLLVNSLDLSMAYNLEKIEEVAFSTAELVKETSGNCIVAKFDENKNYPVGLRKLIFGDNKNLISLEAGAFAFSDFENLIINTNFVQDSSKYNCVVDDNGTILGADMAPILYKSNIENLTVKPVKENDAYIGQKNETDSTFSTAGMIVDKLKIESGIKEIGESAFTGSTFNSIVLPEGLEKIGEYAFRGTLNLTSLTIPSTVTEIGVRAFYHLPETCVLTVNRPQAGMILGNEWHGKATPTFVE